MICNLNNAQSQNYHASGTRRGFSLNKLIIRSTSSFLVKSLSADSRNKSEIRSSVRRFRRGDFTRFMVEKLLSASADETGKELLE